MEHIIYKTVQDCVNLEVSNRVYVMYGEGFSVENLFSSFVYAVKRFNSGELVSYYNENGFGEFFDISLMHEHFTKAVSRRGPSAIIHDSFESEDYSGGQPAHWGEYTNQPTFMVDEVLCVCTGLRDGLYTFLPLSEYVKQLAKKKRNKDADDHQRYLDRDY